MKFAASFSGGKDSTLAIKRMLDQGKEVVALIVSTKKGQDQSWTHNLDKKYFQEVARILGAEVFFTESGVEDYEALFEDALRESKVIGAEACIFGDIDIEGHLDWNRKRCAGAGLACLHPLEYEDRRAILEEFLDTGLEARIVKVNTDYLDESFIGRLLDRSLLEELSSYKGLDLCGENGEYHTRVDQESIEKNI